MTLLFAINLHAPKQIFNNSLCISASETGTVVLFKIAIFQNKNPDAAVGRADFHSLITRITVRLLAFEVDAEHRDVQQR